MKRALSARILFKITLVFLILFSFSLIESKTPADQIISLLESGGSNRRAGMWYIYQERRPELLRRAAVYLLSSDDQEDQLQVLRVFDAFGENLETALPDWYRFVDKYMQVGRPESMLMKSMDLIVKWKEYRLMDALLRMAEHPMRPVRAHAFASLSQMKNDQVLPILLKNSQSTRAIERVYALEGMSKVGDSRLAPFAERLLNDPNRSVRISAMQGYAEQPGAEGNSYAIARLYQSDADEEVRERVIETIVTRKWGQHASLVGQACSDPSSLVRKIAFNGARLFNLAQSVSRQLEMESDPGLRKLGIQTLVAIGNSGGGSGLTRILATDEDPALRLMAASTLAFFHERSALGALQQSARQDPSEQVRIESADALGEMGDPSVYPTLFASIEDEGETYSVKSAALLSYFRLPVADKRNALLSLAARTRDPVLSREIRRIVQARPNIY